MTWPAGKQKKSNAVDVGWVIDPAREASFIWDAPRRLTRPEGRTAHAKGLSNCPAVTDHESRLFEIACPIDIKLRFFRDANGNPSMAAVDGDQSTIRPQQFSQMVMASHPSEWRHPQRPLIQVMTPLQFIADEPVWLTQYPAFYNRPLPPIPGIMVGGRFPIHIWPRELVFAFEWHDINADLVIRRGDPWFYVGFETDDPSRHVRLVEAEMTEGLKAYTNGMRGVTNYVSRTFSLFGTAKTRRPKTLLSPKRR
ncbi:MAG: hypothetical protein H0U98_10915 [Alphaproteobacteria bacterium]|nr:hypothetical protein [Alphaproteobacteria bacterium]